MKILVTGLLGTGAGGLVLLAYLSLQGQQEVKQEIHVDKARIEVESAKFDKAFDEKWAAMDGKKLSKSTQAGHEKRIDAAATNLEQEKKKLAGAEEDSKKDLAEIKAGINDFEAKGANKSR